MSKIKNGGLDQYDVEPFEQQQFGTAGVEGLKHKLTTDFGVTGRPKRWWSPSNQHPKLTRELTTANYS